MSDLIHALLGSSLGVIIGFFIVNLGEERRQKEIQKLMKECNKQLDEYIRKFEKMKIRDRG
jgi:uncharacterized membrane-anchored protein YhcB (DUF1043 family)